MDAENRAAVRRIVPNTGTIEGSKDDPEAGASTPGIPRASPSIRRNGEDYPQW